MFEKEAEEYAKDCEKEFHTSYGACLYSFKDGAEFGYNKANEWHYPSKGELPENNKLCLIQMKTGTFEIAYRVTDLCWKYKNTTFSCSFQSEIYAWKELPKEGE